jgi:hypothetical protein
LGSFRALFGASVEIRTRDGKSAKASCEVPDGAAGADEDATDRLVSEKLHRFGEPFLGAAGVRRLEAIVANLDRARDLSELAATLAPTVGAPRGEGLE